MLNFREEMVKIRKDKRVLRDFDEEVETFLEELIIMLKQLNYSEYLNIKYLDFVVHHKHRLSVYSNVLEVDDGLVLDFEPDFEVMELLEPLISKFRDEGLEVSNIDDSGFRLNIMFD